MTFALKRLMGFGTCTPMAIDVFALCMTLSWEAPVAGEVFCGSMGGYIWYLCNKVGAEAVKAMFGSIQDTMCDPSWQYPYYFGPMGKTPFAREALVSQPTYPRWPSSFTAKSNIILEQGVVKEILVAVSFTKQLEAFVSTPNVTDQLSMKSIFNCSGSGTIYHIEYSNSTEPLNCTFAQDVGYCQITANYLEILLSSFNFTFSNPKQPLVFAGESICNDNVTCLHWVGANNAPLPAFVQYTESKETRIPISLEVLFGNQSVWRQQFVEFSTTEPDNSLFAVPFKCASV